MSEEKVISSPFPEVDIPNISIGEYLFNQLNSFDDSSPVLVKYWTYLRLCIKIN